MERDDIVTRKAVAVLGAGPAGMFAALAAAALGRHVDIYSVKRPSQMFGAQYLHGPIPGVSGDPFPVEYQLDGTAHGYAAKVYGPEMAAMMEERVSPARLLGVHSAWDIRAAYMKVYEKLEPHIINARVTPEALAELTDDTSYQMVVSSIPANVLCVDGHDFIEASIYACGDAPEAGVACPIRTRLNTVRCSGDPDIGWYRASNILGFNTVEYPGYRRPPIAGIVGITKPLRTNCTCWGYYHLGFPGRSPRHHPAVLRVGRYGTWNKGVLSHQSFEWTYRALR